MTTCPGHRSVRWNQLLLNDTGEPMLVTQIVKLWPLPIGNVSSISTTGVTSGWIPLGESYLVRWMVSDRDLFVVDDVPLMSLLPANTLDIAARGRGGSLTTRLVFLREGRLRVDWFLCPKLDCVEAYFSKDFRYQGSQEFQGRLEATSRYPAIE